MNFNVNLNFLWPCGEDVLFPLSLSHHYLHAHFYIHSFPSAPTPRQLHLPFHTK